MMTKKEQQSMRVFDHFNSFNGVVCPVCQTAADTQTILIPIPGTEDGNICEARQVHKKCYDLVNEMQAIEDDWK